MEKPHATDATGIRSVIESAKKGAALKGKSTHGASAMAYYQMYELTGNARYRTAALALATALISEGIYLSSQLGREVTIDEVRERSISTSMADV